jgi:hypothetical protein
MSSPAVPSRRPRDDEDDSDESESTARSSLNPSNKRPRLSGVEDERSDEDGSESESDSSDSQEELTQVASQRRRAHPEVGPGGYKPGAIVRIKVSNFVTYTSAEFFPGPKLNMVIGPNGTGKSTLVCAICLGLGWGPAVCYLPSNHHYINQGVSNSQSTISTSDALRISVNLSSMAPVKR